MRTKLILFFPIFLLTVLISIGNASANAQSRFSALVGNEARGYAVPQDTVLLDRQNYLGEHQTVERYQQYVGNAQVLGGQLTVFKDTAGEATLVMGAHYPDLLPSNQIVLAPGEAKAIAAQSIGIKGRWNANLAINPDSGRFFYIVENQQPDSRWFHWIDAESGMVVNAYNGLTSGSGTGVLGDSKSWSDSTLSTFANNTIWQMSSNSGRQVTYDAQNKSENSITTLPGVLATDQDDAWNTLGRLSPGQPAIVDAQYYASLTDLYYLGLGFDWVSKVGKPMVSSVHLGSGYNNAFWNGRQMAYGDGDGINFREFSGDLDVVAHELTHAVTEKTSNLIYQNESGALNEAFSDIMGTVIERDYDGNKLPDFSNWTLGEDVTLAMYAKDGNTKGIRSLANPTLFNDPSCYQNRYTGTSDNGGVHTNSGIANHWFYLLSQGGTNADPSCSPPGSVGVTGGVGIITARDIAFKGFTSLPSTATFCDARISTIASATGASINSVTAAWDEVGVTGTLCSGTSGGGSNGTLAVKVSTDKVSYTFGQKITLTVNAVDGSQGCTPAVQGSSVKLTITTPVKTLSGSASTNASCNAVFSYTPRKSDGSGAWTASATATKTGYSQATGQAAFTVK